MEAFACSIRSVIEEKRLDVKFYEEATELDKYNPAILESLENVLVFYNETIDPTTNPEDSFMYVDIQSIDVNDGFISPNEIVGKDAPSRARMAIHKGNIVISTCRPTRKAIAMIPRNIEGEIASTGFSIVGVNERYNPNYVFHALRMEETAIQLGRYSSGSSYPAVLEKHIRRVRIPIPPHKVQDTIAKTMENAYAQRREKLNASINIRNNIQPKLLDFLGVSIKEFPEIKRLIIPFHKIKDVGRFKFEMVTATDRVNFNGVNEVKIKNIAQLIGERIKPFEDNHEAEYNYVGLENIESNTGKLVNFEPVLGGNIFSSSTVFKIDDILFSKMRVYLNKVWLSEFDGICSNEAIVLRINEEKADPVYIRDVLLTDIALHQIIPMQTGSSLPRVNPKDIMAIRIPLPSLEEQKRIRKFLLEQRANARHLEQEAEQVVTEAKVRVEKMIMGEEE